MSSIERELVNLGDNIDWSQNKIVTNFNNMIKNVNNMINKNGPTYSTWIYFQLGTKEPLIFNTSSTDKERNIIANLSIDKGNSGVANTFTLTVNFDPFNFGQDTKTKVEKLDDYVAEAMYVDWNSSDEQTKLKGILQYGYNSTGNGDDKLVSPQYEFLLTSAKSNIKYNSGIGTYTFEGTSTLAADSDYTGKFTAVKGWKPLDIVLWTLFYYYGDANNIPNGLASDSKPSASASNYNYKIDVSQSLIDENKGTPEIDLEATEGNIWQYCQNILTTYPLTKADIDAGITQDKLNDMNAEDRPAYQMYITEQKNSKTIHITHYSPKRTENDELKIDYTFTWSNTDQNLMLDWQPEADLYLYMINKFKYLRTKDTVNLDKIAEQADQNNGVTESWEEKMSRLSQENVLELYDATMTTIGIPADAPVTCRITVIPTILESVSRTAGIYIIKSATDNISSDGTFTTEFKLFRIKGLNDVKTTSAKDKAKNSTDGTKDNKQYVYTDLYTRQEITSSNKNTNSNKTYNRKTTNLASDLAKSNIKLVQKKDMVNPITNNVQLVK